MLVCMMKKIFFLKKNALGLERVVFWCVVWLEDFSVTLAVLELAL